MTASASDQEVDVSSTIVRGSNNNNNNNSTKTSLSSSSASIRIKCIYKSEMRIMSIAVPITYNTIRERLRSMYKDDVYIRWVDSENDSICIKSQLDLDHAINEFRSNSKATNMKLFLTDIAGPSTCFNRKGGSINSSSIASSNMFLQKQKSLSLHGSSMSCGNNGGMFMSSPKTHNKSPSLGAISATLSPPRRTGSLSSLNSVSTTNSLDGHAGGLFLRDIGGFSDRCHLTAFDHPTHPWTSADISDNRVDTDDTAILRIGVSTDPRVDDVPQSPVIALTDTNSKLSNTGKEFLSHQLAELEAQMVHEAEEVPGTIRRVTPVVNVHTASHFPGASVPISVASPKGRGSFTVMSPTKSDDIAAKGSSSLSISRNIRPGDCVSGTNDCCNNACCPLRRSVSQPVFVVHSRSNSGTCTPDLTSGSSLKMSRSYGSGSVRSLREVDNVVETFQKESSVVYMNDGSVKGRQVSPPPGSHGIVSYHSKVDMDEFPRQRSRSEPSSMQSDLIMSHLLPGAKGGIFIPESDDIPEQVDESQCSGDVSEVDDASGNFVSDDRSFFSGLSNSGGDFRPRPTAAVPSRCSRSMSGQYLGINADNVMRKRQSAAVFSSATSSAGSTVVSPGGVFTVEGTQTLSMVPKPGKWRKGNLLGYGAFGQVFLCLDEDTGAELAVKQVHLNSVAGETSQDVVQLQTEIDMLHTLRDKHIVHYFGTECNGAVLNIFMEFMPGGSIANRLKQYGALSEPIVSRYTKQILKGILYLHTNHIVHRDIKGANILVDAHGCVKLADFGASKRLHGIVSHSGFKSLQGTPYWMSPEVISGSGHGRKSDVWSLGCTVYEMITTKPPWADMEPVAALFKIGSSTTPPEFPLSISTNALNFMLSCFERDPSYRPFVDELLQHPLVVDVDV